MFTWPQEGARRKRNFRLRILLASGVFEWGYLTTKKGFVACTEQFIKIRANLKVTTVFTYSKHIYQPMRARAVAQSFYDIWLTCAYSLNYSPISLKSNTYFTKSWNSILLWILPQYSLLYSIIKYYKTKPNVNLMHTLLIPQASSIVNLSRELRVFARVLTGSMVWLRSLCLINSFGFPMPHCITVALLNTLVTFPYKRSWRKTLQILLCFRYISIFGLTVCLSLTTFCYV